MAHGRDRVFHVLNQLVRRGKMIRKSQRRPSALAVKKRNAPDARRHTPWMHLFDWPTMEKEGSSISVIPAAKLKPFKPTCVTRNGG